MLYPLKVCISLCRMPQPLFTVHLCSSMVNNIARTKENIITSRIHCPHCRTQNVVAYLCLQYLDIVQFDWATKKAIYLERRQRNNIWTLLRCDCCNPYPEGVILTSPSDNHTLAFCARSNQYHTLCTCVHRVAFQWLRGTWNVTPNTSHKTLWYSKSALEGYHVTLQRSSRKQVCRALFIQVGVLSHSL